MYKAFFKRFIDFSVALTALIVVFPILLIVVVLLCIVNKGKPFFFQPRPGKNEQVFKIIKLKTMNDQRDINGNLLPDNKRLTKIGNFVRKISFDEIPQLINVVKGDMSLIGPRPLLVEYLPLYNDFQKKRHKLRPGITGWAQVNGRNLISWEEKFELDIWYIDNLSFWLDIKILFLTIIKVFKREGVNAGNYVTMEKFKINFML